MSLHSFSFRETCFVKIKYFIHPLIFFMLQPTRSHLINVPQCHRGSRGNRTWAWKKSRLFYYWYAYKYLYVLIVLTIATNFALISRSTAGAIIYHEHVFLSKLKRGPRLRWQYRWAPACTLLQTNPTPSACTMLPAIIVAHTLWAQVDKISCTSFRRELVDQFFNSAKSTWPLRSLTFVL